MSRRRGPFQEFPGSTQPDNEPLEWPISPAVPPARDGESPTQASNQRDTDRAKARQRERKSSLTAKAVDGLKWTYLATVINGGMQLVFAAIMGRLLDPAAFGLMAMALAVLSLSQHFGQMGITHALIQKVTLDPSDVRAGFTSSTALGVVAAVLAWLVAPLVGSLFSEPAIVPIFRAMGLALVVAGFGMTAEALLRRELRFRDLAYRDIFSYAVGYLGVGIGMAFAGAGVWSLVAAAVTQSAVKSVVCYARTRHSVRPVFAWGAYRPLYSFGSRMSLIGIIEFASAQLDVLAIGRYATTALLGNYNRAFVLVNIPLRQLMTGVSKVLFPSFSRIQHDVARLRLVYLGVTRASLAIVLPIAAGMSVAANEIVLSVLGDQWSRAASVLPLAAAAGGLHLMNHYSGIVCDALAELQKKMIVQAGHLVVLALTLWTAVGYGLWAYAAAFALAQLVRQVAYMYLMRRILAVRAQDLRNIYGRAIIAAAIVAGVISLGRQAMVALAVPVVLTLGVEIALGAVTLVGLLRHGTLRPVAEDVLQRLKHAGMHAGSGLAYRAAYALLGGGSG